MPIRTIMSVVVALFLAAVPFVLESINFITLVIFRAMIATLFLILGDSVLPLIMKLRKCRMSVLVLMTMIYFILDWIVFMLTGHTGAALNVLDFGNPIYYIVNALLGTAFMILAVAVVERIKIIALKNIVSFYGKESLIVMGTHQILMLVLCIPIKNIYVWNFLFCAIVMLAEVPVIFVIRKIKTILHLKG